MNPHTQPYRPADLAGHAVKRSHLGRRFLCAAALLLAAWTGKNQPQTRQLVFLEKPFCVATEGSVGTRHHTKKASL